MPKQTLFVKGRLNHVEKYRNSDECLEVSEKGYIFAPLTV